MSAFDLLAPSPTRRGDKERAAQYGIPKAFRQYANRYGGGSDVLIQAQRQFPADTLDAAGRKATNERWARDVFGLARR